MHAFLVQSAEHLPIPVPELGDQIRLRRITLGMNIRRAASLTGIKRSNWLAIEAGLIPTNERLLRALASTLEIRYDLLASVIAPLEAHFADVEA